MSATSAQAAIINGGFNGNLNGWQSSGDVNVVNNQALLVTGLIAASDIFTLETFLGLSPGQLVPNGSLFGATGGSALKQSFTANAGDILRFDWNFLTDEVFDPSLPKNDTAFLTLVNTTNLVSNVITLADVSSSVLGTGELGFARATGTSLFSQTLVGGNYILGFVVVDDVDTLVASGLAIDNVQVGRNGQIIPEPSSVLAILALGAITVSARRKYQ